LRSGSRVLRFYRRREKVTPAPDEGYSIGNIAEGENALFSLTAGDDNVAIGYEALFNNTSGTVNMGSTYWAVYSDKTGTRNTATGNAGVSHNITRGSNTPRTLTQCHWSTQTDVGTFVLNANTIDSPRCGKHCEHHNKAPSSTSDGAEQTPSYEQLIFPINNC
jgi:hypothetical protein